MAAGALLCSTAPARMRRPLVLARPRGPALAPTAAGSLLCSAANQIDPPPPPGHAPPSVGAAASSPPMTRAAQWRPAATVLVASTIFLFAAVDSARWRTADTSLPVPPHSFPTPIPVTASSSSSSDATAAGDKELSFLDENGRPDDPSSSQPRASRAAASGYFTTILTREADDATTLDNDRRAYVQAKRAKIAKSRSASVGETASGESGV